MTVKALEPGGVSPRSGEISERALPAAVEVSPTQRAGPITPCFVFCFVYACFCLKPLLAFYKRGCMRMLAWLRWRGQRRAGRETVEDPGGHVKMV